MAKIDAMFWKVGEIWPVAVYPAFKTIKRRSVRGFLAWRLDGTKQVWARTVMGALRLLEKEKAE